MKKRVPIALSNRHIHISKEDLNVLFGERYVLTKFKDLSQPNQYACEETITIKGDKGFIENVRILGPTREETQLEISISDSFILGVEPIIRQSGDIDGTPGLELIGPNGSVKLKKGVIVASRHIHMHTDDALKFELKDKSIVKVKTEGIRSVIFENVLVRVSDAFSLEMHVDIEEGNAAGIKNGTMVEIL